MLAPVIRGLAQNSNSDTSLTTEGLMSIHELVDYPMFQWISGGKRRRDIHSNHEEQRAPLEVWDQDWGDIAVSIPDLNQREETGVLRVEHRFGAGKAIGSPGLCGYAPVAQ